MDLLVPVLYGLAYAVYAYDFVVNLLNNYVEILHEFDMMCS